MGKFGATSTAADVCEGVRLKGKTVVVTGCNSGLGQETVRVLSERGAFVVGTARSVEKAKTAMSGLNGVGLECELTSPSSVADAARALRGLGRPLDAMICNAGVMAPAEHRSVLGLELQFMTNHIGHFMLVSQSESALSPKGRVVVVSSGAHRKAPRSGIQFEDLLGARHYDPWTMYGQSKLANILFAKQLAKRWRGTGRTANAVHPGVIRTNLGRHLPDADAMYARLTLKSIAEGAATQLLVAIRPEYRATTGMYFSDCAFAKPSRHAKDSALAERLWHESQSLVDGFATLGTC